MSKSEESMGRIFVSVLGVLILSALNLLIALFVMLGLGVLHDQWVQVPAFGYWETYLVMMAVSWFAGALHGGLKVKQTKE